MRKEMEGSGRDIFRFYATIFHKRLKKITKYLNRPSSRELNLNTKQIFPQDRDFRSVRLVTTRKLLIVHEISCSHSGEYIFWDLAPCINWPTFQRCLLPLPSWRSPLSFLNLFMRRKKTEETGRQKERKKQNQLFTHATVQIPCLWRTGDSRDNLRGRSPVSYRITSSLGRSCST
jgi:hypothetical protein